MRTLTTILASLCLVLGPVAGASAMQPEPLPDAPQPEAGNGEAPNTTTPLPSSTESAAPAPAAEARDQVEQGQKGPIALLVILMVVGVVCMGAGGFLLWKVVQRKQAKR